MADKVLFGVSNLHIGEYTVNTSGAAVLGTPYAVPGTVKISLEPQSEENKFYADNMVYWSGYSDSGYEGEIENAFFPDDFKTKFLNYKSLNNGGIAQIKGQKNKTVYIMFQSEGDEGARRGILYNCSLGQIQREYNTVQDSIEPATATLPFTVNGDNKTGVVRAAFTSGASVYTTMFTNPPTPSTT